MKKQANNQPSYAATAEPLWLKESVPFDAIIKHDPLQVRLKLDPSAIRRYADMTKAGNVAPLIKVGRVNHPQKGHTYYLVDGWHRLEAGAVPIFGTSADWGEASVQALVAPLTEQEVRWEAARANLGHGVPLKRSEYRNVFKAFIKASKHHLKAKGELMSYREIAEAMGVGVTHTTLRNWMLKDFPSTARAMGGSENGNTEGEAPPTSILTLEQEHVVQAQRALEVLVQHMQAMGCPKSRGALMQGLDKAMRALKAAGVEEPEPSEF